MLLENKTAIVYGAAGSIGSAVARAYAREGAKVHLVGRTGLTLEPVAQRILADGGEAHVAEVDVLDRTAVERHADSASAMSGRVDICFNATSNDDVQGTPLVDMHVDDFLRPVTKAVTAHFVVATTVGRLMAAMGGGVVLVMGGGREAIPRLGGSHVAWAALAGLCRQLASELGSDGVRVAWLLSPGSPDPGEQVSERHSGDAAGDRPGEPSGFLGPHPSYEEVASAAVFAASDWARTITAAEINLTGGAVVD